MQYFTNYSATGRAEFMPTEEHRDLWQYLRRRHLDGAHIVMYGMGNGADKILAVCERYGIEVSDFFASDGFVRGHLFHGKTVLSYSDVKEKYGTDGMIILLSFASARPDVIENIERIAAECELYAPDVPVFGDTLFDSDYYTQNLDSIRTVRELFADEESKRVLDGIIAFKLSGRIDLLRATESSAEDAYKNILHTERFCTAADLGAYNGDTIRKLLEYAPNLTDIIAFEPDRRNFKKLSDYSENEPRCRIHPINAGAWSEKTVLEFDDSGNRNANLARNTSSVLLDGAKKIKIKSVETDTLDRVAAELGLENIDYVKYDVEGSEKEALLGSQQIIRDNAPALLVSLYHRSEDIFTLPIMLSRMQPRYKFYLRRMTGIPAWDINLYATVL